MSPKFQELNLPISLKFLANTAVFLPLFGFGFCLIWSFWFDYEVSILHKFFDFTNFFGKKSYKYIYHIANIRKMLKKNSAFIKILKVSNFSFMNI